MNHIDKRTNSPAYRRKLKKFTEAIKSYRKLVKIPGQAPKLKANVSPRELANYNDKNALRPDRAMIRYFLALTESGSDRRQPAAPRENENTSSDSNTIQS